MCEASGNDGPMPSDEVCHTRDIGPSTTYHSSINPSPRAKSPGPGFSTSSPPVGKRERELWRPHAAILARRRGRSGEIGGVFRGGGGGGVFPGEGNSCRLVRRRDTG